MRTVYWISVTLVSIVLLWSAYSYFFNKATIAGVSALGFPDFFRIQLAILKIIAVVILMMPQIPITIKEWAYAGVGLFFITAIVAHLAHKDSIVISLLNVIFIVLLVVSHVYMHKLVNVP